MDLKQALGATEAASAQRFSLYLPDSDRNGAPVPRIDDWIGAAMRLFADINGGATRLPTAQGIWNPGSGEPVREATSVVYSFIRDTTHFEANLPRLSAFIHTFGKHADQGEVMVEFSGEAPGGFVSRAYFIDRYPNAGPPPFP